MADLLGWWGTGSSSHGPSVAVTELVCARDGLCGVMGTDRARGSLGRPFCAQPMGNLGWCLSPCPAEGLDVPLLGLCRAGGGWEEEEEEEEQADPERVRLCQAAYWSRCTGRRGASHKNHHDNKAEYFIYNSEELESGFIKKKKLKIKKHG